MKKVYVKVALAVIIFLVFQLLSGVVVNLVNPEVREAAIKGEDVSAMIPATSLALAVILSGLLTCLVLWMMKMIRLPQALDFFKIRWCPALLGIVAAVMGIFATSLASELLKLPDLMADVFLELVNNVWGILGIAVIGPVAEELVFREAIQGSMERKGVNVWLAMFISALCFGIIHFNPAQVPFAFIMGIVLSIIYHKTGNVVVTSIVHILNNSQAVVLMRLMGEDAKDFSTAEWLGFKTLEAWGLVVILGVICVLLLMRYWKMETVKKEEVCIGE